MLKRFRHPLVSLVTALSISGCRTGIDSPQKAYDGTVISHDQYAGMTDVVGATLSDSAFPTLVQSKHLAGQVDRSGKSVAWLYVSHDEPNVLNAFETAHDDRAQPLATKAFSRVRAAGVNEFSHEEVAVIFPDGYLASHAGTGMNIRLEGRHGAIVVTVPALYIQGYLRKLAEVEACTKAKTC
ncbi:MAG: hypothetical protein JWO51_4395 [Rhodospirillales bacterium]|nr:hypothetical protein [Rhodospirillales bacterium]